MTDELVENVTTEEVPEEATDAPEEVVEEAPPEEEVPTTDEPDDAEEHATEFDAPVSFDEAVELRDRMEIWARQDHETIMHKWGDPGRNKHLMPLIKDTFDFLKRATGI